MPIYSKRPKTARIGDTYYVFHGSVSQGPYDLQFVQAMVLSGMLPADVTISTDGKTGWQRLDSLVPAHELRTSGGESTPSPPLPNYTDTSLPSLKARARNKAALIVAACIGVVVVLFACLSGQPSSPVPSSTYEQPSAPQAESPTYQPAQAPAATPVDNSTVYQPPASVPVATDTTAPPVQDTSAPAAQPVYAPPDPPPEPTYAVRDNSGRIFHVSRADYNVLTQKEGALTRMMEAINQLKAARAEQNRLIESERATLDNTNQNALDQFNAQVDQYNAGGATLDRDIDAYNAGVDDHNAYLIRVGTPAN